MDGRVPHPLLALRFTLGRTRSSGSTSRFIRRKNEETLALVRPGAGVLRLNHLKERSPISGICTSHDLELYPYAPRSGRGDGARQRRQGDMGGYFGGKGGVDANSASHRPLTADVPVSTDFAQVEADQQVINLTRFPFFFPRSAVLPRIERELDLGTPGRVQLFYSRRIGLDTSGAPVPILAGAGSTGGSGVEDRCPRRADRPGRQGQRRG